MTSCSLHIKICQSRQDGHCGSFFFFDEGNSSGSAVLAASHLSCVYDDYHNELHSNASLRLSAFSIAKSTEPCVDGFDKTNFKI